VFNVYLNEKAIILTGVEFNRISVYKNKKHPNSRILENYSLNFNFNQFYFNKNKKLREIKKSQNPGERWINIEINYLEDIKLCKLTHKIEIEEDEFLKMINDEEDIEIKLEEIEA